MAVGSPNISKPTIAAIKNEATMISNPTIDCQIFSHALEICFGSPPALTN